MVRARLSRGVVARVGLPDGEGELGAGLGVSFGSRMLGRDGVGSNEDEVGSAMVYGVLSAGRQGQGAVFAEWERR
jgi:hypothetical protein